MARRKSRPKPAPRNGFQANGGWHTFYDLGRETGEKIAKGENPGTEMVSGFARDWTDSNGRNRKGEALGYPRSYYQGLRDGMKVTRTVTVIREVRDNTGTERLQCWTVEKPETLDNTLEFRRWCRENGDACSRFFRSGGTIKGLHGLWLSQAKAG